MRMFHDFFLSRDVERRRPIALLTQAHLPFPLFLTPRWWHTRANYQRRFVEWAVGARPFFIYSVVYKQVFRPLMWKQG